MGIKKISALNEMDIVTAMRKWPLTNRVTWELLRKFLVESQPRGSSPIWSRQSLSANETIKVAFSALKARQIQMRTQSGPMSRDLKPTRIAELESELSELRTKYDRLLLRHAQLSYNASLLEGGTQLLDPLPDNTRSQTG